MAAMLQPQIILLKEGTDTSQGKAQVVSNINACTAVADTVRTTLGPRGMDKLIHDDKGNTTISNDGATIMKLLDIVHPAAKILVDIAKSQDSEVGDGTTTVVLLAGEFLKEANPFIEDGVHPQNLIRSYRAAGNLAISKVKELSVSIEGKSLEEKKSLLAKCAATTLSSKLIGGEKEFFAEMVVDAVLAIVNDDRLNLLGIKKVPGGTMRDSFLVNGVAFKKTFSYAGFEQQPKKFLNPKILLLNIELELKSEKENAEIRLSDPLQYQSIVDAEWNIIYDKLDKCVKSGAKIVLSRLAIGDLATQIEIYSAMVCTRPDIGHAVGVVSRFMSNPGKAHWEAVKWILRYLRGTTQKCLHFSKGEVEVQGYVDADFGGEVDHRRSTTGYVFTVGTTAVSWMSQVQKIVTLSTTEAEYVAVTEASKEMIWLQGLLTELGFKQEKNVLHSDSQSAIHLAKNSAFHSRTKHIALRYHFIRSLLEDDVLKLEKIPGSKNPVDMLTKTVTVQKLELCATSVGLHA